MSAGKLDGAATELRKALDMDSANAGAHYALGKVWDRQRDAPAAMREWRRALEIDPQNADIHDALGDALLAQGRRAEALTEWRTAIELRPNDVATLERAAWLLATSPNASVRNGAKRCRWRRGRCSTQFGRTRAYSIPWRRHTRKKAISNMPGPWSGRRWLHKGSKVSRN